MPDDASLGRSKRASCRDTFAFGPFEFDAAAGILYRGEQETLLPPKAAGVLAVLLERAGQLVSKDELLGAVWPDTHVTESVLTDAISLLRHVLGDDAREPTFIQTLHRRGYRFIGEVKSLEGAEASRQPSGVAASEAAPPSSVPSAGVGLAGRPSEAGIGITGAPVPRGVEGAVGRGAPGAEGLGAASTEGEGSRPSELRVGARLGKYEIVGSLGAGAMGRVYRARDTVLEREVAIKVLPEALVRDAERAERLEREAKILASVSHPNIAAIHGLEEADGIKFPVLELVEGETLEERLRRGRIPMEEALEIGRQIAAGVEAAHERGVLHRDLKPANIKLTPSGQVKVLDFGLAKALEVEVFAGEVAESPTASLTIRGTYRGAIVGTAAYMSPEQARGQEVDRRADIWAFGCVLYEMLTGRKAFEAETVSDTIARLIEREPDWEALPEDTPASIRRLLQRCLRKPPTERLQHIGDARIVLKDAMEGSLEAAGVMHGGAALEQPHVAASVRSPLALAAMVLVAALAGALVVVWVVTGRSTPPPEAEEWHITLPDGAFLERGVHTGGYLAISPDGELLAYAARSRGIQQLHLMPLGRPRDARSLPGTEGAYHPFFSPDGQSIGFFANRELKSVSIGGERARRLCALPGNFEGVGAAWHPDGVIYFVDRAVPRPFSLYRVSEGGGEPELVAEPDAGRFWFIDLLPDATAFLAQRDGPRRVELLSLNASSAVELARDADDPRYLPTGHVVFARPPGPQPNKTLYAAPFDLATHTITGAPQPILEDVLGYPAGITHFSVSQNGTLAYVSSAGALTPVWVDRRSNETPLGVEEERFGVPNVLSPDGRRILTSDFRGEMWIYDLDSQTWDQLVDREMAEPFPTLRQSSRATWSPDGTSIAYGSPGGLYRLRLDESSADPELLLVVEAGETGGESRDTPINLSWSPDGRLIAYQLYGRNIYVLPLDGDRTPFLFATGAMPTFSPDGRWIAYRGIEGNTFGIWVRRLPEGGGLTLIHEGLGGSSPVRWRADGKELFYNNGRGEMWAVEIEFDPTLRLNRRELLFQGPYPARWSSFHFDVTADGQRFLVKKEDLTRIIVVKNWFEEVKRRLGIGG